MLNSRLFTRCSPFSPESAILVDSSEPSRIACLSESLSKYRWFYEFEGFSLLLSSYLPSIRSNLTIDDDRLDSKGL